MMEQKDLQVFNFEGKQTRVVMKDGAPWWVTVDVCEVLGLGNPTEAIKPLDDDEKNTLRISEGIRGNPNMNVINESGLYTLIMRSNKPEAKKFRKWVTSEVLPSIRKHGTYMTPQKIEEVTFKPDTLTTVIQALKEEQEALKMAQGKTRELEIQIEEQQSLVSFAESLQEDLSNQNIILIGGFRKILREGNMLFVWVDPSSGVKGIAPLSAAITVQEVGDACRLTLIDGGTQ